MFPGQMQSDAELVRAAQRGDSTSLGLLLERYRAPLYGLALQLLGRRADAQDAVHDTFLVALCKLDQVREPAAVGGWLHMVLRNACRIRLRAGCREALFDEFPPYLEARSPEPSAEERIDRLALRDWVWTALARLPETLRVTVMLRYFGSHASYEEIAAILGLPVGTVRSRLNQAKAKLGEALLEAASLEHSEARQRTEYVARYFSAAVEEINAGTGYALLADAYSDDPELVVADGKILRGRRHLIEDLEGDLEVGMKMRLTNVFASRDITILEANFENPPTDPLRCPPATTQVHFQRDGKCHRARFYFAPRPRSGEGPTEER